MMHAEIDFIERIAAEATHEIMNGLASIGQSVGLMEDLMAMGLIGGNKGFLGLGGRKSKGIDVRAKCEKSLASVRSSINKTMNVSMALNRFIHGQDAEGKHISAREAIETVEALMSRPARRRRTEIQVSSIEKFSDMNLKPAAAYRVLIGCLDALLAEAEPGTVIEIACRAQGDGVLFELSSGRPVSRNEELAGLEVTAEKLKAEGGSLEISGDGLSAFFPVVQ